MVHALIRQGAGDLALSPNARARGHCAPPLPVSLAGALFRVKGWESHCASGTNSSLKVHLPSLAWPNHQPDLLTVLCRGPPGCHRSLPADPRLARRPLGRSQATRPCSVGSGAAPSGGRPPGDCAVLGSLGMPLLRAAALAGELSTASSLRNACTKKRGGWRERDEESNRVQGRRKG